VEGSASISGDVLAAYAADAALEVPGVTGLVDGPRRHRGVRVTDSGGVALELQLAVEWGVSVGDVGGAVQQRVTEYLQRMAEVTPIRVDVVVAEIGAPAADAR
jgi:uncharacterized alkaline shock family protein YloU